MGVQSRRRRLQKLLKPNLKPAAVEVPIEEQKARYHHNWVAGHPLPKYRQTNNGPDYDGPKTAAPKPEKPAKQSTRCGNLVTPTMAQAAMAVLANIRRRPTNTPKPASKGGRVQTI